MERAAEAPAGWNYWPPTHAGGSDLDPRSAPLHIGLHKWRLFHRLKRGRSGFFADHRYVVQVKAKDAVVARRLTDDSRSVFKCKN